MAAGTLEVVRHTRLDSLLLAGVGTLAVHELAYLPGSVGTSLAGGPGHHAHMPLLWGLSGAVAIAALVHYVVRAMRGRPGHRFVDAPSLGLAIGALYISQEAAERALSNKPSISLLSESVLWLGLLVVPVVSVLLARLVSGLVAVAAPGLLKPRFFQSATMSRSQTPIANAVSPLERLAYALVRRGPPAMPFT